MKRRKRRRNRRIRRRSGITTRGYAGGDSIASLPDWAISPFWSETSASLVGGSAPDWTIMAKSLVAQL